MSIGTEARALLNKNYQAILSTNSVEMPGYPFGSVVPYCLDRSGNPIILISRIAQHTKNILADPKVSMITIEQGLDDAQIGGRLTWVADAKQLEGDEEQAAAARYYQYFPKSKDFHRVHDFDFYRLELARARYIGGFGKIHWLATDKVLLPNAFAAEDEQHMIDHMNNDHLAAMKKYCAHANIPAETDEIVMVGIDEEGFDLRVEDRIIRFEFTEPANTAEEVRKRLVAMARV